jgi:hypothetical protein
MMTRSEGSDIAKYCRSHVLARVEQSRVSMYQPEHRRFPRYDVHASVEVTTDKGRQQLQTEDLGAGGCRITVASPLEKGTMVGVRLTSSGTALEAKGQARVAWASQGEPYRVGLAFDDGLAEQVIPVMLKILEASQNRSDAA